MAPEPLSTLIARGVHVPWPDQVVVEPDVDPGRIEPGARLEPFVRLAGSRTLVRSGAVLGAEGPVRIQDCGIGRNARIASGTFTRCLFLDGVRFGPSGHAREGTLFEEGASAAHAVGTKQTILLPHAVLGSNVNFCDALLAGGTGARDHSEVGSGFIHFNFTPFGPRGDKATPSLFGDVPRGVWLRERRIFVGGAAGVVGPLSVGFGSVLAAGSVYRRDRPEGVLALGEPIPGEERVFDPGHVRRPGEKLRRNLVYLANLAALHHVYRMVRRALAAGDPFQAALVEMGVELLAASMEERLTQLRRFAEGLEASREGEGREAALRAGLAPALVEAGPALVDPERAAERAGQEAFQELARHLPAAGGEYLSWVSHLPEGAVEAGRRHLDAVVQAYLEDLRGAGRVMSLLDEGR